MIIKVEKSHIIKLKKIKNYQLIVIFFNLNNKIDFDEKTKINKKNEKSTHRVIKTIKKVLNKINETNSDDEMEKIKKNDNIGFYEYKYKNNKKNCQNIRNHKLMKKIFNLKPGCYPRYPSKNFPVYKNVEIKSIIYKKIKNLLQIRKIILLIDI